MQSGQKATCVDEIAAQMEAISVEEPRANPMDMICIEVAEAPKPMLMAPTQDGMGVFDKTHWMPDLCNVDFENLRFNEEWQLEGMHCADFGANDMDGSGPKAMRRDVTDVPVEELRPCCAICCSMASLFCGCPSCLGVTGSCAVICCLCKCVLCKCLDCKDENKKCCTPVQCNWYMTKPNKCFECIGQYCCLDGRAAFPCTNKVPCACTILPFCMLCADWKFVCKFWPKLGDAIPRLNERSGKDTTME